GGARGDNCAPLPPLAGEGRDGAGSEATHCPHPNPPPLAGEGAGVAGGPRADGRAPLPPLAGEGRDGGRVRGDRLPPPPPSPASGGGSRCRGRGEGGRLCAPSPPCRRRPGWGPGPVAPTA